MPGTIESVRESWSYIIQFRVGDCSNPTPNLPFPDLLLETGYRCRVASSSFYCHVLPFDTNCSRGGGSRLPSSATKTEHSKINLKLTVFRRPKTIDRCLQPLFTARQYYTPGTSKQQSSFRSPCRCIFRFFISTAEWFSLCNYECC